MDARTVHQFGLRLDEYISALNLDRFSIVFHGGEPLLYTAEGLVRLVTQVRSLIRMSCRLDFSLQTNGVLLTEQALRTLAQAGIAISLSLDGPKHIHDRHRLNHQKKSTFEETMDALRRLIAAGPDVFSGVIAVIDPSAPPRALFEFFAPMALPRLDLLLPDATHAVHPLGREEDEGCYRQWLEEAFDLWFHEYPGLPIRWFDAVLGSRLGVPSPTDVMGFGSVSLIVIETDGSYTDHDVFKIVGNSEAQLRASVFSASFSDISSHPKLLEHAHRLTFDGLARECKSCPVVEACGGGCVMHRAHPERGLEAPTVYCGEMFSLMSVATRALRSSLEKSAVGPLEPFTGRTLDLIERCREWRRETEQQANEKALSLGIERGSASAAAILLLPTQAERSGYWAVADEKGSATKWLSSIRIQPKDPRLVAPFSDSIRLLPPSSTELEYALDSLDAIEACLRAFSPSLPEAMAALLSDIIFVESTVPSEGGIFSFSDDTAPNVLYIAPYAGGHPISPDDLADSIYHEFLHQVLHHFERGGDLLFDRFHPRFPAPWRHGLRQSGGFLHGAFVFTGLAQYWAALAEKELPGLDRSKARGNADRAAQQAAHGIKCLREFALLTPRGMYLLESLADELGVSSERIQAPGILATATAL